MSIYKCGVKVITVYIFSLENFHRPIEQVDAIMELLKSRVSRYYEPGGLLRHMELDSECWVAWNCWMMT